MHVTLPKNKLILLAVTSLASQLRLVRPAQRHPGARTMSAIRQISDISHGHPLEYRIRC